MWQLYPRQIRSIVRKDVPKNHARLIAPFVLRLLIILRVPQQNSRHDSASHPPIRNQSCRLPSHRVPDRLVVVVKRVGVADLEHRGTAPISVQEVVRWLRQSSGG